LHFTNSYGKLVTQQHSYKILILIHSFCLDDLQFADDESLDLISNIVASKAKIVFIVTYRPEEVNLDRLKGLIEPSEDIGVTKIDLKPLSEEDVIIYTAATLHRPKEYVLPLAAVIQERCAGNPFLVSIVLQRQYIHGLTAIDSRNA